MDSRTLFRRSCRLALVAASLSLTAPSLLCSQDTLTVMTYNLLGYVTANDPRDSLFRRIIDEVGPDILVVQEINTQPAVDGFLMNVLRAGVSSEYEAGPFLDGPDTDNAIFFRKDRFAVVSNMPLHTALRDISEFSVVHSRTLEQFYIYSVHLKAGAQDSIARAAEVDVLRSRTNSLPVGSDFIVVGDFNVYGSYESAYQKLLKDDPGNDGNFLDPLSMQGRWNDSSFAPYHTQSTRTRSFGGGATGGLDDRFDMILHSRGAAIAGGLMMLPGTYRALGNDGNHFNDSINRLPNGSVSSDVANALHGASDHLPVVQSFSVTPDTGGGSEGEKSDLLQNFPNPFSSSTTFFVQVATPGEITVKIFDLLGQELATLMRENKPLGLYPLTWNAWGYSAGVYFCRMTSVEGTITRPLMLLK